MILSNFCAILVFFFSDRVDASWRLLREKQGYPFFIEQVLNLRKCKSSNSSEIKLVYLIIRIWYPERNDIVELYSSHLLICDENHELFFFIFFNFFTFWVNENGTMPFSLFFSLDINNDLRLHALTLLPSYLEQSVGPYLHKNSVDIHLTGWRKVLTVVIICLQITEKQK